MNQAELYNAIVQEDRLLTCGHGCGVAVPNLSECWFEVSGESRLHIRAECPRCGRWIKWARQLRKGSLEEAPW